jgi:isopenicillin N synthase-like dioxygenase
MCFAVVVIIPVSVRQSVFRWAHPFTPFNRPALFQLFVRPGTIKVLQGETVSIKVDFRGRRFVPPILEIEPDGEKPYSIFLTSPFEYKLESVRKKTDYFVHSGKVRSKRYTIEVKERPMIRMMQLILHPPAYSRMEASRQEPNAGDVDALAGTEVEMSVTANKPIRAARAIFEREKPADLASKKQNAKGRFIIKYNERYWIELEDDFGEKNINPIHYTIRIKPDRFPFVRIVSPEKNSDLDQSMVVPLVLEVEDDFGISQCRLGYYLDKRSVSPGQGSDTSFFAIPVEGKQPSRLSILQKWDLGSSHLLPEDVVSYFIEATDNDRVAGPKSARSDVYTLRFPSIEDIYREMEKEQADQIHGLNDLFTETESFQAVIRQIDDDLKAGKVFEWEEKKNIEEKIGQQKEQISQLDNLADRLGSMIERMNENNLLDDQTLQKYQELQTLYEEMATPEWKEAMKKLQDAFERVSQEDMRKAMEGLQISQKALLRSLERTISLLKRLRIEQKTEELIQRICNMAKRQNEIDSILEKPQRNEKNLTSQEESIQEDTRAFQAETQKLRNEMQSLSGMPLDLMENAIQSVLSPQLSDEAAAMGRELQKQNRDDALSRGRKIEQQMQRAERSLKEMQKKLQENQRERIVGAMREMSLGLLELSQEQESLQTQIEKGSFLQKTIEEKQQSISEALDQKADSLYRLSFETFLVSPEMGKSLGEAKSAMQQALDGMKNMEFTKAGHFQQKAVGALNRTVITALKGMDQLGQGSGSGMESFFLQLQGMGEEQAALNRKLSDLLGQGRLSLEAQSGMARLAAEQESIKERLLEMIREFGYRSDITGNLNQLVKNMEQAIQEMQERKADRQTIQNQERILSRLLDAQRSLNSQDFSKKRQARTAQDINRRGPAPIQDQNSKKLDRLRKDILEAAKEGYTKEYLDLIQKYFDALLMINQNREFYFDPDHSKN